MLHVVADAGHCRSSWRFQTASDDRRASARRMISRSSSDGGTVRVVSISNDIAAGFERNPLTGYQPDSVRKAPVPPPYTSSSMGERPPEIISWPIHAATGSAALPHPP